MALPDPESTPGVGLRIEIRGLSHEYGTPHARVQALTDISFEVSAGDYVALMGPSGAGKSTLLALLGGLDRPQEGTLAIDGRDMRALSRDQLAEYRRTTVGFVFQHFGLVDLLTAAENVELALSLAGVPPHQRRQHVGALLSSVGLLERRNHRPSSLSGGERQRVAIARALANDPRLLLADEPTGNLDSKTAVGVMDLLESLRRERGCTLLVVTHNPLVAARADRRVVIDSGRIVL
ncbi:MAG TPA: ABC transporter ATP-binding protein [Candidatus Dormibacteraeota bacterium]